MNSSQKGRILAADDQPENLELLAEILTSEGFEVREAIDGEEALEAAEMTNFDCVILDVMMPRLDGYHVCRSLKTRRRTRFIPVIMLTALSDSTDKALGLNLGADDYLSKPVYPAELIARVRSLIRIKRLRDEIDQAEATLLTFVKAIDARLGRSGHSERVAVNSLRLATHLGLPAGEAESMGWGAILHDIGMVSLSPHGFRREDAEISQEWKTHPEAGARFLSGISGFEAVREIVRNHHQRLDGSGFPALEGGFPSLGVQIVSITNEFDGLLLAGKNAEEAGQDLRLAAGQKAYRLDLVNEFLREDERLPYRPGGPTPDWQELVTPLSSSSPGRIAIVAATRANKDTLSHMLQTAGHHILHLETLPDFRHPLAEDFDLAVFEPSALDDRTFGEIRRFKAGPGGAERPLLLCSGPHSRNARQQAVEAGIDEFLPLPLDGLEVVARVKSLLRQQLYFRGLDQFRTAVKGIDETARKNHSWWASGVSRLRPSFPA